MNGGFSLNCTKTTLIFFVLKVFIKTRSQNRICIESQEKENKTLYIAHEEMGGKLQLPFNNSKFEEGQGDY